jgi:hypothetical protein
MFSILAIAMYECETRFIELSEEHRLRMLGDRVLRRISGPNREE